MNESPRGRRRELPQAVQSMNYVHGERARNEPYAMLGSLLSIAGAIFVVGAIEDPDARLFWVLGPLCLAQGVLFLRIHARVTRRHEIDELRKRF